MLLHRLKHSTFCELKPSLLAPGGVGVFAIRDIPKNTNLFVDALPTFWDELTAEQVAGCPHEVQELLSRFVVLSEDGVRYVPFYGMNNLSILYYINHSESPNVRIDEEAGDEYEDGRATPSGYVTIRRVRKGEELCYDYRTVDGAIELFASSE